MTAPLVSIVLPTYNRAAFLPQAFASIRAQELADWELVIVDDGSTDDTEAVVARLRRDVAQPVRYVRQANAGPYAARNAGLDLARGRAVAFFDSDDVWLPHHLRACDEALRDHPEVDWAYGACRVVDFRSGRTLHPSTFCDESGRPRPFRRLRARTAGSLRIIDDPRAVRFAIAGGLQNGLQNSVIRRRVFDGRRFVDHYRNEAEDQLFAIRAVAAGHRVAYYDDVHVVYHVHGGNSSAAAVGAPLERQLWIYRALVRGFEELRGEVRLSRAETRVLDRRLAREYFWHLGYALLWQHGRRDEALAMFRRGLRLDPWDLRYWKVYAAALAKWSWFRAVPPRAVNSAEPS
jgi:glycosyltransferase involved in cell wall biosynthesis